MTLKFTQNHLSIAHAILQTVGLRGVLELQVVVAPFLAVRLEITLAGIVLAEGAAEAI